MQNVCLKNYVFYVNYVFKNKLYAKHNVSCRSRRRGIWFLGFCAAKYIFFVVSSRRCMKQNIGFTRRRDVATRIFFVASSRRCAKQNIDLT